MSSSPPETAQNATMTIVITTNAMRTRLDVRECPSYVKFLPGSDADSVHPEWPATTPSVSGF
jgi:hypothetical protein